MLIIVGIVCAVAAFLMGVTYRKLQAEKMISSAEEEASRIMEVAKELAETKKKEVVLEGKEEVQKFRSETEKELSERRKDIQRQERRVVQKEENLDRKTENLELQEKNILMREKEIEDQYRQAEAVKKSQFEMLEKISGMTSAQAKSFLLEKMLKYSYINPNKEIKPTINLKKMHYKGANSYFNLDGIIYYEQSFLKK